MQVCGGFGAVLHPVFLSGVKEKPFQEGRLQSIHGNTSALLHVLRAAGFPCGLPEVTELKDTQT